MAIFYLAPKGIESIGFATVAMIYVCTASYIKYFSLKSIRDYWMKDAEEIKNNFLEPYLVLEETVKICKENNADENTIKDLLSSMDKIWYRLTDEERKFLNSRKKMENEKTD